MGYVQFPADRGKLIHSNAGKASEMSVEARIVSNRSQAPLRVRGAGPPRVLLLTSTLGAGHARAAQAIELAVRARDPDAKLQTLDLWSLMHPDVADAVRQTYLRLVQEYPGLYERVYQLDERTWRRVIEGEQPPPTDLRECVDRIAAILADGTPLVPRVGPYALDCALLPLLCSSMPRGDGDSPLRDARIRMPLLAWIWTRLSRRLERRLRTFQPDVVVATQMVPAALLSAVKLRRGITVPCIGVPTDYGVHDFWIQPGTDAFCVAHAEIPGLARARAVAVSVTGVPLMPGFARPPEPMLARSELGLDPARPVVLLLGGGLGLGVDSAAERLLQHRADAQFVLVAGYNTRSRRSLAARRADRQPLRVVGWTEHMESYIRAADLVVGKPGGLTVAEVLACGRPLLATRTLGGQEGFNVRFLERHGVGRLVPEDELLEIIEAWLAQPDRLDELKRRAWSIGRRDGAARVAELTLAAARSTGPMLAAGVEA